MLDQTKKPKPPEMINPIMVRLTTQSPTKLVREQNSLPKLPIKSNPALQKAEIE